MHKKNLTTLSLANEKLVIPTTWVDNSFVNEKSPSFTENELQNIITTTSGVKLDIIKYPTYCVHKVNAADYVIEIAGYRDLIDNAYRTSIKPHNRITNRVNMTIHPVYFTEQRQFGAGMFEKFFLDSSKQYFNAYYDFLQLDETSDVDSNNRHYLTTQPFRLLKGVLNQHVVDILQNNKFSTEKLTKLLLLNTKYSQSGETLRDKELLPETLWGFRQKKYKRMKKFKFKPDVIYDPVTFKIIGHKALPTSPTIDIAGIELQRREATSSGHFEGSDVTFKDRDKTIEESFNYRISARINRHRSELVPVTLARRLLRTKRTLVLPAHVNLTVITNSYDVVHS